MSRDRQERRGVKAEGMRGQRERDGRGRQARRKRVREGRAGSRVKKETGMTRGRGGKKGDRRKRGRCSGKMGRERNARGK